MLGQAGRRAGGQAVRPRWTIAGPGGVRFARAGVGADSSL